MILLIKNNIYKTLLGTFISLVSLFLLLKIVDSFEKTLESLTSVSIFYLAIGFLIYFLSLFLRTYRWKILLKKNVDSIKFKSLLNVVISGYMFNNLLPARLGELARIYHLSLLKKINKSFVLGSILAERVTDVIVLMLFLLVGLIFIPREFTENFSSKLNISIEIVYISLIILLSLTSIFILIILTGLWKEITHKFLKLLKKINSKFNPDKYIESFTEGAFSISNKKFIKVVVIATLLWAIEFSMFYLIGTQFNFDIENLFIAILFFGIFSNLGGIIPSTSGGWGPFEVIGTIVLTSFGVDSNEAAAFTILVHLILWLPISIVGLITFIIDFRKSKS
ncbi:MAG: YbhN family protein [Dehalococcoidia bacterium]